MSADHDTVFHAKAPLKEGLQAASIGAGVGLLVSAVQNSIGTHSAGATGVFARTGNTIGIFGNALSLSLSLSLFLTAAYLRIHDNANLRAIQETGSDKDADQDLMA